MSDSKIVRGLIITAVILIAGITIAKSQQSVPSPVETGQKHITTTITNKSKAKQPGSYEVPLVVEIKPIPPVKDEIDKETKEREGKESSDRWTFIFSALVTVANCFLAIFTILLWRSTDKLWLSAKAQSGDMKQSLEIAKDSADATKKIVSTMESNAKKQLRSYLSVIIDTGIYQDEKLLFEAKPSLRNTGFTPAYKVSYWAKAGVFPSPLPDNFTLTSEAEMTKRDAVLAPHHSFQLSALVEKRFGDSEAEDIKFGKGKKVYVWGKVIYEDIFGETHYTNFFHGISWLVNTVNGMVMVAGHYENKHNDAT